MNNLYLVDGSDGMRIAVGPRQANWLLGEGHVTLERSEQTSARTGVNFYKAAALNAQEINELVCATRELAECDLCPPPRPATSIVRVRNAFNVELPGLGWPAFNRPVFLCESCAELVRANAKLQLISATVEGWARRALDEGILPHEARKVAGAYFGGFIRAVFAHRQGPPEALS